MDTTPITLPATASESFFTGLFIVILLEFGTNCLITLITKLFQFSQGPAGNPGLAGATGYKGDKVGFVLQGLF